MKKRKVAVWLGISIIMVFLSQSMFLNQKLFASQEDKKVTIVFTHDLHSHLDTTESGGEVKGGFAKLATKINEIKNEGNTTFVLDAGDFSMGTLYQTIYETQAAELILFGRLGFDAVTFGNHEFDYRTEGVTNMFNSAVRISEEENIKMPEFVCANLDWSKNTSEKATALKTAYENYGGKKYTIIEKDGIKAGIFGIMGDNSVDYAPESGLVFDDRIKSAKAVVKQLKAENVDIIICLSHSGTGEDKNTSEDDLLAKAVPEIDVIISGHTHTVLEEPIIHGNTYIVSSGSYGSLLGEVELVSSENDRWEIEEYVLHPIDETIADDKTILEEISKYKEMVGSEYLERFGYTYDQVLAYSPFDFTPVEKFGEEHREDTLGNLISDSYIYAVKEAEGESYETVDVAIVGAGVIRESFAKGDITVADVFQVSSLGIGEDRIAGYPLVGAYLTGKELKLVAELDASISPFMGSIQLYPSGMGWTFNPNRMILNKVTDVVILREDKNVEANFYTEQLEDNKLYRVVTGLYSLQMLGTIEDTTFGLLSLVPKDKQGNPITDYESCIIHNLNTGEEVKEWVALATYLTSFEKNENGVSVISDKYEAVEGRKVVNDTWNLIELLKNPNKYFFMITGAGLALIAAIVGIVILVVKRIKTSGNKNKN